MSSTFRQMMRHGCFHRKPHKLSGLWESVRKPDRLNGGTEWEGEATALQIFTRLWHWKKRCEVVSRRVAQPTRLGREATGCLTLGVRRLETSRELSVRHLVPAAPSRAGWVTRLVSRTSAKQWGEAPAEPQAERTGPAISTGSRGSAPAGEKSATTVAESSRRGSAGASPSRRNTPLLSGQTLSSLSATIRLTLETRSVPLRCRNTAGRPTDRPVDSRFPIADPRS